MDAFSKVHMTLHCLQWYMITGPVRSTNVSTVILLAHIQKQEQLKRCMLSPEVVKGRRYRSRGTQEATDELLGSIVIGIVTRTHKVCRSLSTRSWWKYVLD